MRSQATAASECETSATVPAELAPFLDSLAMLLANRGSINCRDLSTFSGMSILNSRSAPYASFAFDAEVDTSARASAPNASIDV